MHTNSHSMVIASKRMVHGTKTFAQKSPSGGYLMRSLIRGVCTLPHVCPSHLLLKSFNSDILISWFEEEVVSKVDSSRAN